MSERPEPKWERGTVERPGQPKEGRTVSEYVEDMGFDPKSFEGLTVLDLGASKQGRFATNLKEQGVNANVISVSPDYSAEEFRTPLDEESHKTAGRVAALGQQLPFPDGTFDRVVSMRMLEHITDRESYLEIVNEIVRVLKPGGKAYLSPLMPSAWDDNASFNPYLEEKEIPSDTASFVIENIDAKKRTKRVQDNMGNTMGNIPIQRIIITKE